MSFPLFLRGMLFALMAFAITTYYLTQSFWRALLWTLVCAVIIQVGYFIAILLMVWGHSGTPDTGETAQEPKKSGASADETRPGDKSEHVSG